MQQLGGHSHLTPTRASVAFVSSFMFFRVLSLMALDKWNAELGAADALAFVWDVLLAAGLLGLGRLTHLGEQASRVQRALGFAAVALLVFSAFLARAADVAYTALTGGHWVSAGFLYVNLRDLELLQDGDGPLLVACLGGATLVSWLALFFDSRAARAHAPSKAPSLAMIAVAGLGLPFTAGFGAAEEDSARFVPEALFVHEWLSWRDELAGVHDQDLVLRDTVRRRFVQAGLLSDKPLDPAYPLSRATLDPTPFPYPRLPDAPDRPNLVFTLVEQLNHEFVHAFSGELEGVMPGLSALAKRMTMVTSYQSTASPTIHALVASLCSVHCASHTRELNAGKGSEALVRTPLSCLPELLGKLGYRTVFIQGGKKEFAGKGDFLGAHGFQEVHGRPELEAFRPGSHVSRWGMHDDLLVQYTEAQIARLEALQAQDGRPYFIAMLTLDTHSPGLAPRECKLPKNLAAISDDRDSRNMLRSLRCSDRALSQLGRFIVDDPVRSKKTLWALTGDHPTSAMRFVNELHEARGRRYTGWSGRLPLMLHVPTHALPREVPVLSSHLDLAPTLLHILGVRDVPNAMTGFSIFGRRSQLPMLVGRVGPKYVALYRPGKTKSVTLDKLESMCRARAPMLEGDLHALSACELHTWVRWQDALWAKKRIMPAPAKAAR